MKEVIKALNTALLELPLWKKPLLVIAYPVLLIGVWLAWRVAGAEGSPLDEEESDDIKEVK